MNRQHKKRSTTRVRRRTRRHLDEITDTEYDELEDPMSLGGTEKVKNAEGL